MKKHLMNLERLLSKLQERLGPEDELVRELLTELEKVRHVARQRKP